jgi:hypothetical protein
MVAGWWQEGVMRDTDWREGGRMLTQRIRSVKPEFFVHEELAGLSLAARLLFIGLWTVADREGRLEDRPRRLKAMLFPYDCVDIEQLLAELAAHRFIHRYEIDDLTYIHIPTFLKHQRPNPRERPSEAPSCTCRIMQRTCRMKSARAREEGGGEGEGEGEGEREGILSLASLAPVCAPGFEDFWQRYPLHVGKQAARKAWGKLGPSPPLGLIVDALAWQRELPRWREDGGRYVPHPATYLNGRRWEDERPPPTALERFAAEGNTG